MVTVPLDGPVALEDGPAAVRTSAIVKTPYMKQSSLFIRTIQYNTIPDI